MASGQWQDSDRHIALTLTSASASLVGLVFTAMTFLVRSPSEETIIKVLSLSINILKVLIGGFLVSSIFGLFSVMSQQRVIVYIAAAFFTIAFSMLVAVIALTVVL